MFVSNFLVRGDRDIAGSAKGRASGFSLISKLSWMVPSPLNRPGNCLGVNLGEQIQCLDGWYIALEGSAEAS